MLGDAASVRPDDLPAFDICIIGAGAAGITLALELERSGKSICLLESGGWSFEAGSQGLCEAVESDMNSGALTGRLRMLGGCTNHWGGRTGTLDALDMAEKIWLPGSGWPIVRGEMDPYYARARKWCHVAETPDPSRFLSDLPEFLRQGTPDLALCTWWGTPVSADVGLKFASAYRDRLVGSGRVFVITHANVARFLLDGGRRAVTAVAVRALNGWRAEIRANLFVLAAGGIENSRLLLVGTGEGSLGNRNTGRYFLQHLRGRVGLAFPNANTPIMSACLSDNALNSPEERPSFQTGLQLTPECRRREGLLNACAFMSYRASAAVEGIRDIEVGLREGRWVSDLGERMWSVVHDSSLVDALARYVIHQPIVPQSAEILVDVEQVPQANNRITLSDTNDALGVPLPAIAWQSHELERRTIRRMAMAVTTELARQRMARCKLDDWLSDDQSLISEGTYATFHFSGGTRMAVGSDDGVVDPNCKVFELDNLHICGSSVFPSVGHVNPTLTIVALAIRLADRLVTLD